MSIIDVLTEGFNLTARKLWLAALPALLDVFLWIGPKVSIAPVIERIVASFRQAMAATTAGTQDVALNQMFESIISELQNTIGRSNLLALLAWGRLGVPSIAGTRAISPGVDHVWGITSYGQMLFVQLLIMAVGLLIACVFLGAISQQVRGEALDIGKLLRRTPIHWLRIAAIFVPLGFMLIFLFSISFMFGAFVFFIWVSILWAMLYLYFVPQAIMLAELRPLNALWSSMAIVRMNFWSSLGLVILVNLIGTGLGLLLRLLMATALGTFAAILANAFVGTGLTAAAFVFYRDRVARWQEALEHQKRST